MNDSKRGPGRRRDNLLSKEQIMRLTSNRRSFIGSLTAIASAILMPFKGAFAATGAQKPTTTVTGFGSTGNPYEELGVPTVINAEGTMTVLGGSLPHPELEAVMAMAGRHFVSIVDLEVAAGNRIAQLLKLPDGYTALVTSGAAAAMATCCLPATA